jgi:hypothetical protein
MVKISADQFADVIEDELKLFGKDVVVGINKAARVVAKNSPIRTGKYSLSWSSRKESGALGEDAYTVYNKEHYRLTHLLENGHINRRTGSRVSAIPHIATAEEAAINEFLKELEEMDL